MHLQPLASKTELGQPLGDEHLLLDDNKYIADVVYELRANKQKDFTASKLLFKKRMFRETDETITEPQFVNLSYVQAQHDYLQVSLRAQASPCVLVALRCKRCSLQSHSAMI